MASDSSLFMAGPGNNSHNVSSSSQLSCTICMDSTKANHFNRFMCVARCCFCTGTLVDARFPNDFVCFNMCSIDDDISGGVLVGSSMVGC